MAEKVKRYMTLVEVAARFGVHVRTIRRWWLSGKTCLKAWNPDHRIGSRGLRFTTESVDAFELSGVILPEEYEDGIEPQYHQM